MATTNITATKETPKTIPFRTLRANEITCSLMDVGENGALVLLYPNPAAVQDILDEAVGQIGWQRRHYAVGGGVYCSLGVRMGDGFIWKDDAGDCNGTQKVKGSATDKEQLRQ
ncbi:MAG: hypothetical protein PHG02_04945 [Oscillospiraceae bacterium]|nr:hypothetical protein [Oscillospiraceae bacterium]